MPDVVYVAKIKIERDRGPLRTAYLPVNQTVQFGVHGDIAKHYGVSPDISEPQTTTIDYVIAAAGGWLTGTFGGALEARQVDASNKKLTAEVTGEVELEDNVLVIRRIHVLYSISATKEAKETIERVHRVHADYCPVYKSLHKAIEITTEYQLI